MTRGKEVQDFIKENKKFARERFEEAGWYYDGRTYSFNYCKEVLEDKENGYYIEYQITFDRYERKVSLDCGFESGIDMETLKLINYQCEELGWL